jgi:hypothetical protein
MGGEISGNRDTSNRGDFLDNIDDCTDQRLHGGNEVRNQEDGAHLT